MLNIQYSFLERFTDNLKEQLISICTRRGMLGGEFYIIDELTVKWKESAPQYMADAVPEIKDYPTVAIAWACYFGIGAASFWDLAWDQLKDIPDLYLYIRSKRGFDNMDEYVMEELSGLKENSPNEEENKNAKTLTSTIQQCARTALTLIRKEGIEPQSKEAFYLFYNVTELFFYLGVSLELYRLGYKYEKELLN